MSQKGDRKSYEKALKEIYSHLMPVIKNKILDSHAAEDIMQEILISIHNSLHTYDPKRRIYPWLNAIARRRCVDYFRKALKVKNIPLSENISDPASENYLELSLKEMMQKALAKLPEGQRKILELTKLNGYSFNEAAELMNTSRGNVRVLAHRASISLHAVLKGSGYDIQ